MQKKNFIAALMAAAFANLATAGGNAVAAASGAQIGANAFPEMLPRPVQIGPLIAIPTFAPSVLVPTRAAGYGTLDTEFVDLPTNFDADYLRSLTMRDGRDMAYVVREIESRFRAMNSATDPLIARLSAAPTTEAFVENPAGEELEWTKHTQYTPARPQQTNEPGGHNLAIGSWEASLGWTEEGLEEMRSSTILRQIDGLARGAKRRHRKLFLKRLFGSFEEKQDKNSTATSPGAIGSGTGGNAWTPSTFPDGYALPVGYSHYFRVASGESTLRPAIKTAKGYLNKYLGEGTYEAIGTTSGIAALMALTTDATIQFSGFIGTVGPLMAASANDARSLVDPNQFVGTVDGDIAVRKPLEDFSGAYFWLGRSQGNFAEGNPIVMRYDELRGRGAFLRSRGSYPLAQAIGLEWYGYNWINRANGVLFYLAGSGGYIDPTI